jgi:hypothetical protein
MASLSRFDRDRAPTERQIGKTDLIKTCLRQHWRDVHVDELFFA